MGQTGVNLRKILVPNITWDIHFLKCLLFSMVFWNSALWLEIISSDKFITITNELPPKVFNLLSRYMTIIITKVAVVKLWDALLGIFGPDYEIKLLIECCQREAGKIIKSEDQNICCKTMCSINDMEVEPTKSQYSSISW